MTKSLKSLWGRFLFQDRGILPTKRFMLIVMILSILLVIGSVLEISWVSIITVDIMMIVASFLDLFFSPKKAQLTIKRSLPEELERGLNYKTVIEVTNASSWPLTYRIIDGLPQSFITSFPLLGEIPRKSTVQVTYEMTATKRGNYDVSKLYFRFKSFLGLWEKQITLEMNDSVKVIPDLSETKQYLANEQRFLVNEGLQIRKHRSGVGDFSKIRSYVVGDDPRKINWRQTAKLQEVMTNDYEPEHGKYITLLIDCGRMMGAELKKGNRLEKSLEAALTVAAAALKKGDYVSVLAFSKKIKVFVPPAKGMAHLKVILKAVYDINVEATESNYASVLQYLETVQKKRSLLLLFSDVRTFLHEESALTYLKRLRQRHMFLMVGIEDETLLKRRNEEPKDVHAAMVKSMAQQQLLFKKREKIKWEKQGLQMIEAPEEKLAITAVSQYIDIMNQNLL
ncbi:DUF58 domain-containing protein [Neobacillus drentensis]|uniref:DUF58 domain-containing protein n=1 Tax=Neobacillus drentensis TaxID=220684 RepID=UPI002FFD5F9C